MGLSIEYIAGFFDGEGCIKLSQGQAKLRLTFTQTSREVLDEILKTLDFGVVSECVRKNPKSHWKRQWFYATQNRSDSVRLLKMMVPFLIVKKEKAITALELCEKNDCTKRETIKRFVQWVNDRRRMGDDWWAMANSLGTTKDVIRKSYAIYNDRVTSSEVFRVKAIPKWMTMGSIPI
jgi:signal recognition particle subunit SEC65